MLKVKGFIAPVNWSFQTDPYIPISYEMESKDIYPPLYWFAKTSSDNKLEVKLNQHTGVIEAIIVINRCNMRRVDKLIEGVQVIEGVPLCDISRWPVDDFNLDNYGLRFIDECYEFQTLIGQEFVRVELVPASEIATIYVAGKLRCLVDNDNNLCAFEFINLSAEEIACVSDNRC